VLVARFTLQQPRGPASQYRWPLAPLLHQMLLCMEVEREQSV
jgi:hypothetical protein